MIALVCSVDVHGSWFLIASCDVLLFMGEGWASDSSYLSIMY